MPLTPQDFRKLSTRLYRATSEERSDFLTTPESLATELGIEFPAGEARMLREQGRILVHAEDGERSFRTRSVIIFSDGHLGMDESGMRRWHVPSDAPKLGEGAWTDTFEDMVRTELLGTQQTPGAAICVVQGGKRLFAKGYGCRKVGSPDPVSEDSLFQVGSISKVLTAAAILELARSGKAADGIDLDADINRYLPGDCQLPAFDGTLAAEAGITLRNLLTHTAGFEENQVGAMSMAPRNPVPLPDLVTRLRPARVREAVKTLPTTACTDASYSNYGVTLAGQVLARRHGTTFEQALAHSMKRWGMQRSTFGEPLPPDWEPQRAHGHERRKDAPDAGHIWLASPPTHCGEAGTLFEARGFEFVSAIAPASGLTTTAADMGQFMIRQLAGDLHDATMVRPQDPDVGGGCMGFREIMRNGRRILLHRGAMLYSSAVLVLIPEEKVGLFVAVNAGSPAIRARTNWLVRDFIDTYFPSTPGAPRLGPGKARRYGGRYLATPRSHTRTEKALLLYPRYETRIEATSDTTLAIENLSWKQWLEIGDGVFRQAGDGGQDALEFRHDGKHIVGPDAFAPLQKLAWHEAPSFHRGLLTVTALCFAAWLAGSAPAPHVVPWALATLVSVLNLFALAAGFLTLRDPRQLATGYPLMFRAGLGAVLASLVFTVVLVLWTAAAWLLGWWTPADWVAYALFAIPALAFLWSMHCWNLIGLRPSW